jgi:DNA repair ATPase RecN
LLLGAKNDSTAINDTSRACVVEGEFDIARLGLEAAFAELDIEYDAETIIRRTISPSGKSRAFVNDQPVQLADLKQLGAYLIDIHSQHQNLILSSPQFRIRAIDTIAGNGATLAEYSIAFTALQEAKRHLDELVAGAKRNADEEDWLRHQAEELQKASLRVGEIEELEAELRTLENADSISAAETAGKVAGRCHYEVVDNFSKGDGRKGEEVELQLRCGISKQCAQCACENCAQRDGNDQGNAEVVVQHNGGISAYGKERRLTHGYLT